MESTPMLINPIWQGDWMCTIDLKDAYFSMPISLGDQKYLRFLWQGQLYQFQALPFGLSAAPKGLHKTVAHSDRPSEEARVQAVDLSGQYYLAEPTEGPARTGAGLYPVVAATVGLHNQLGQVRPVTISTGGL